MKYILLIPLCIYSCILPVEMIAQGVSTFPEEPDETISLSADIAFDGEAGLGEFYIWYGCGRKKINKPVIVVEGFDPLNEHDADFIYNDRINQAGMAEKLRSDGFDIIGLNFANGGDLIQRNAFVLTKLIDVINDSLRHNNSLAKSVVWGYSMGGLVARYGLAYMETNNLSHNTGLFITYDTPHQGANIPLGYQHMAAFWLDFFDRLTNDGIEFRLNPLVSLAIASISPQPALTFNETQQVLFDTDDIDMLEDIEDNMAVLNETVVSQGTGAMEQMINPYYESSNTVRAQFLTDLSSVGGYPQNLRKVAIANGSGTGVKQGLTTLYPSLFNWGYIERKTVGQGDVDVLTIRNDVRILPGRNKKVFHGEIKAGIAFFTNTINYSHTGYATTDGTASGTLYPAIDDAPGGFFDPIGPLLEQLADNINDNGFGTAAVGLNTKYSFIPTISALDINTADYFFDVKTEITGYPYPTQSNITPFDAIYAPDENTGHTSIPDQTIFDAIINEIKQFNPDDIYLQNETVTDDRLYEVNSTIMAGSNVLNSEPQGEFIIAAETDVSLIAGEAIYLEPGFEAEWDAEFHAYLSDFCESVATSCKASDDMVPISDFEKATPDTDHELSGPKETILLYPNPFNSSATIEFTILEEQQVYLEVHNIMGEKVRSLITGLIYPAGRHLVTMDGAGLTPGLYFCQLKTETFETSLKMLFSR